MCNAAFGGRANSSGFRGYVASFRGLARSPRGALKATRAERAHDLLAVYQLSSFVVSAKCL